MRYDRQQEAAPDVPDVVLPKITTPYGDAMVLLDAQRHKIECYLNANWKVTWSNKKKAQRAIQQIEVVRESWPERKKRTAKESAK